MNVTAKTQRRKDLKTTKAGVLEEKFSGVCENAFIPKYSLRLCVFAVYELFWLEGEIHASGIYFDCKQR
jgi:hypothetical protein